VSNVTAHQRPGTEIVEIQYDLSESEALPCWIWVQADRDGSNAWIVPVYSLVGDVGPNVYSGNGKYIEWNADLEITGISSTAPVFTTDFRSRLTISPGGSVLLTVTFTPFEPITYNGVLYIFSNDPDENVVTVTLTGAGTVPDIQLSEYEHDFGGVRVGQSATWDLTIHNTGTADLEITGVMCTPLVFSTDFRSRLTIPPGGSTLLTVTFTPDAATTYNGSMSISSDDPDEGVVIVVLNGEGTEPDIQLSDSEHDFGEVILGESASWYSTISNVGTADLVISNLVCSPSVFTADISSRVTIPPGESVLLTITFTPLDVTTYNGELLVYSDDPDEEVVSMTLAGQGVPVPVPDIVLSEHEHDFGGVVLGDSATWSFTIYNVGSDDLEVTGIVSELPVFSTDFAPRLVILPGDYHQVTVTFTPVEAVVYSGDLIISSNDPDEPQVSVHLQGAGLAGDIDLSATAHDFGDVPVGESADWELLITNLGNDDLNLTAITCDEPVFSTDFAPRLLLPPGASTTVTVTFTPPAAIEYSGQLSIESDDPDEPTVVVALQGTGLAGDIDLSATAHDFGGVTVGETAAWELLITNLGDDHLNLTAVTSDEPVFTTDFEPRLTIPPGASITIVVFFAPLEVIEYTGILSIESDDPDEPVVTVDLDGEGLAAQPPTPFALLTPPDGATVNADSPLLTWEESTDPDSPEPVTYTLFWDTDPGFANADSVEGILATDYTLDGLVDETEYYWRVWAHDLNTDGTPCDADFSFVVAIPEPPLPFSLLAPPDGSTQELPITFVWQEANDPDPDDAVSYWLTISLNPDFTDSVLTVETEESNYYLEDFVPGNYWWRVLAQDGNTDGTMSDEVWSFLIPDGIFNNLRGIPDRFGIVSIYPNPFNPSTTVIFGVPAAGRVEAEVYDLTGRLTEKRTLGLCQPGYHQFTWTPSGSSGLYFLRLRSNQGWEDIRRLLYLK